MTEVVINNCFGGFGISTEAGKWLIENRDWKVTEYDNGSIADPNAELVDSQSSKYGKTRGSRYRLVDDTHRNIELRQNPDLIDCVKALGEDVNTRTSSLKVVEIPDGVEFTIEEYDGNEHIAEKHETWS